MSNLSNLIDTLVDRIEDNIEGWHFDGLEPVGVFRYRLEKDQIAPKFEPAIVVAPAGNGSGWHQNGSHPYGSNGIAVLVYPGRKDMKAGRFVAAQAFSDETHRVLMEMPMPFVWPDEDNPITHVLSIRLESGPEPVVVEGTDWPCMSRLYNVNANTQDAYSY